MKNKDLKEKIEIDECIIEFQKDIPFTWGDIVKEMKKNNINIIETDEIRAEYVEAHNSDNNSYDGHFICSINRKRLETDSEFTKRQKDRERDSKWAKERRYENYLKLKQEFENK